MVRKEKETTPETPIQNPIELKKETYETKPDGSQTIERVWGTEGQPTNTSPTAAIASEAVQMAKDTADIAKQSAAVSTATQQVAAETAQVATETATPSAISSLAKTGSEKLKEIVSGLGEFKANPREIFSTINSSEELVFRHRQCPSCKTKNVPLLNPFSGSGIFGVCSKCNMVIEMAKTAVKSNPEVPSGNIENTLNSSPAEKATAPAPAQTEATIDNTTEQTVVNPNKTAEKNIPNAKTNPSRDKILSDMEALEEALEEMEELIEEIEESGMENPQPAVTTEESKKDDDTSDIDDDDDEDEDEDEDEFDTFELPTIPENPHPNKNRLCIHSFEAVMVVPKNNPDGVPVQAFYCHRCNRTFADGSAMGVN